MRKFLIFAFCFPLLIETAFASYGYWNDVDYDTDYYESIYWMSDEYIIHGYDGGEFGPDSCVNRAEFLSMLYRALEVNIDDYDAELFTDADEEAWYAQTLRAARARGTVSGYSDGTFHPWQCVNRAEALKMGILEFNDFETPEFRLDYGAVTDADQDAWYFDYLDYAMSANLVGLKHTGVESNFHYYYFYPVVEENKIVFKFDGLGNIAYEPSGDLSRKEAAELIFRLMSVRDNDLDIFNGDEPNSLEEEESFENTNSYSYADYEDVTDLVKLYRDIVVDFPYDAKNEERKLLQENAPKGAVFDTRRYLADDDWEDRKEKIIGQLGVEDSQIRGLEYLSENQDFQLLRVVNGPTHATDSNMSDGLVGGGLYKSVDGGENWEKIWDGDLVVSAGVCPNDLNRIYLLETTRYGGGSGESYVQLSTTNDGGKNWVVRDDVVYSEAEDNFEIGLVWAGYSNSLAVDPDNCDVVVVEGAIKIDLEESLFEPVYTNYDGLWF